MFKPATMTSAALIAILALTFYLRLLYFGQYIDGDVGNVAYQAWRMAEGEVLIDLEGPGKPPLYIMLYAGFIHLFGNSVIGLKMFGAVFVLMAVLAVYWLAKQAYGKKVGLLAALLFGVFSSGPMVEGGTVNLETILHLPYILAIGLFINASLSGRRMWYVLAGFTAALGTLVKQVGGVLFFVFLCYGIDQWWAKKPISLRRGLVYRYVLLAAGGLLPVMALTIFFHHHGYTLSQLYDSMLGSNLRYIQRGYEYRQLSSFPLFYLRMRDIFLENGILWLGTIVAAAHLGWRIRLGKEDASGRILLWWAFWSFAVLWTTGTFFWHYFLQMIAPFSVLAAYGIVTSWKSGESLSPLSRFVVKAAWSAVLIVMVIFLVKTDYKYFFTYGSVEQTVLQHEFPDGVFDEYGLYNFFQQGVACYIRDHTDPTETIYVWGVAPQIFFLAQRKAATRYRNNFNMSLNVTGNSLIALKAYTPVVMEDIRGAPPAYIVQIFPLEWFPDLQSFIQDQYVLDRSIELPLSMLPKRFHLYRRRLDRQTEGE